MKDVLVQADALIIGCGPSGMWTAKRMKELNPDADVLIVDKGPDLWGGLMCLSGGDFEAVMPEEDVNDWVKDLVYYWDGLCDQDEIADIYATSYDRMRDYQNLGYSFLRHENGELAPVPQRAMEHCRLYPASEKGTGGQIMANAMIQEMHRLGVRHMGRTQVTDLLKVGNRVVGAVGFDSRTGDFITFQAGAVVVACGNPSWKPGYNGNTSTGEWVKMCLEAGVKMRNFETLTVMNAPKLFFWEGQGIYLALGARFVNALGEPFMDRYSPVLGANTDNNYVTRAMAIEIKEGRGPIYFDLSQVKEEDMIHVRPQTGNQMMNHEKLRAEGVDFLNDKDIEFIPQVQLALGGVVTDHDCASGIDGLYVVGRARSLDYIYLGGFGLCSTAVTGHKAGEAITKYLAGLDDVLSPLPQERIAQLRKSLFAPLGAGSMTPKQLLQQINVLMSHYDVCILKNEESLRAALAELDRICEEDLPQMGASDFHYLLKYKEVEGILTLTRLYLEASLARCESRGAHFRTDYPERNDDEYLGWIVQQLNEDGQLESRVEPVPVERYRNPITRYYSDNFCFTGEEGGGQPCRR